MDNAAAHDAPGRVARYAQELAGALGAFYHDCAVVNAEPTTLRDARLWPVHAAKTALRNTLDLPGIPALEEIQRARPDADFIKRDASGSRCWNERTSSVGRIRGPQPR